MRITLQQLLTHKVVILGRGNLVAGETRQRAEPRMRHSQRSIEERIYISVERYARHPFGAPLQQQEVYIAVFVFLRAFRLNLYNLGKNSILYRVKGIYAVCNTYSIIFAPFRSEKVAAQFCIGICVNPLGNLYPVFIFPPSRKKRSVVARRIYQQRSPRYSRRQSALVIESLFARNLAHGIPVQFGKRNRQLVFRFEFAVAAQPHYCRQRGGAFRNRSEVVNRMNRYRILLLPVKRAESLVIYNFPVAGNKNLTAGIRPLSQPLVYNIVDNPQRVPVHACRFRRSVSEPRSFAPYPRTPCKQTRYVYRQNPFRAKSAEQHLGGALFGNRFILVCQNHRFGVPYHVGISPQRVRRSEEYGNVPFPLASLPYLLQIFCIARMYRCNHYMFPVPACVYVGIVSAHRSKRRVAAAPEIHYGKPLLFDVFERDYGTVVFQQSYSPGI